MMGTPAAMYSNSFNGDIHAAVSCPTTPIETCRWYGISRTSTADMMRRACG